MSYDVWTDDRDPAEPSTGYDHPTAYVDAGGLFPNGARIVFAGTGHCHFDANQHSGMDEAGYAPDDERRPLFVRMPNGTEYGVSAHLYLWTDGEWHHGREFSEREPEQPASPWERGQSLHASQRHAYNTSWSLPPTHRAKIEAAMLAAVIAADTPRLRARARFVDATNRLHATGKVYDDARQALADAARAMDEATANLDDAHAEAARVTADDAA